jgi:hypothetical protein
MPDADEDIVEAIVTVNDSEVSRIHGVAKALGAKGFRVSQVLESSGLIAGKAPRRAFESIRGVKGVDAVEASGSIDIGPPDAGVQ